VEMVNVVDKTVLNKWYTLRRIWGREHLLRKILFPAPSVVYL